MKSIISTLFLAFISSASASNLYTYDCELTSGEFNVPKLFVLDRYSDNMVSIQLEGYVDQLELKNIVAGIKKFKGVSNIFGMNDIEFYLAQSISRGSASGDVSVVVDNYSYEYSCSINWSPY